MTLEDIQKRIDYIKSVAGDPEQAHSREDGLYEEFIEYIATLDNHSLAEKAKLVLTTKNIDFSRWCA